MRSTTTFRRGQAIVVNVPFSDHSGVKPRPAVVVSAETFHRDLLDILICPISSQPQYYDQPGPGDHPLRDWRAAGLHHPSTVRVSKLLAVDKRIVKKGLGSLTHEDMLQVETYLRQALGLW